MALLGLRDVSKRFHDGVREVAVLDGVSFEVFEGERMGVLASRRAGKTTLLRVMSGLEKVDAGVVLWRDCDLAGMGARVRSRVLRCGGIALVRGDQWRRDAGSVLEHVAMPLYSSGFAMSRAEDTARSALGIVEIAKLAHVPAATLCLAERIRVDLAKAIARDPALLLIDEPAVLPRPKEAGMLYELIDALQRRLGFALVVVSEDVTALRGLGRVMNLDSGRLYSTDSRRQVIDMFERRAHGRGGYPGAS